jgi:hypothetical protein
VAVVLLVTATATGGIEAGSTEVNGAGLLMFQLGTGSDASQYGISAEVNHYLSESFAVGGRMAIVGSSYGSTDMLTLGLYPQMTACVPASETVAPYFGAGLGFQYARVSYEGWGGEYSDDQTEPGLLVYLGVKVFASTNVAISFESRYEALFEYMDYGTIGEYVGFSYFF